MNTFYEFEGLGTHWKVGVTEKLPNSATSEIYKSIVAIVREFEGNYSRFLPNSLVSQLNATRKINNPPNELVRMLNFAQDCAKITDNFFSITVGVRLEDIGYDDKYTLKKKDTLRTVPHLRDVLNVTERGITLSKYTSIDFGGFGKGWLIDKIVGHLKARGISSYVIDGGGDIFVSGQPPDGKSIPLEDPWNQEKIIGEILLENGAIASSSPKHRKWPDIATGQTMHHLIDPKSELTPSNVAAVYTHANNATDADTASTALFVSPNELHSRIANYFKASYCIVYADGSFYQTSDYPGTIFSKS